jgi:P4 family phage/plasmid primase-like protien
MTTQKQQQSNSYIISVSKSSPCPICEKPDWCYSISDSPIVCCKRSDTAPDGWIKKSKGKRHDSENSLYFYPESAKFGNYSSGSTSAPPLCSLSSSDRDRGYRLIGGTQIGDYDAACQEELSRRKLSLTERHTCRELDWLMTWARGKEVPAKTPLTLPGISDKTDKTIGTDGLAIGAVNLEGEILGYQVRMLGENVGKDGRYRAISGGVGSSWKLSNNEQPITVWQYKYYSDDSSIPITRVIFAEGFLKSLLIALNLWRLGLTHIAVVGTPGSKFGTHKQQIQAVLEAFPDAIYELAPDAGMLENTSVMNGYKDLYKLVPSLKVLWWGQVSKTDEGDDIDDYLVQGKDFNSIVSIEWDEFQSKGNTQSPPPDNSDANGGKPNGDGNKGKGDDLTPASKVAASIAAKVKESLIFDNQCHQWRRYENKKWNIETDEAIKRLFHFWTESEDGEIKSFGRVKNVADFARSHLFAAEWQPLNTLKHIPFNNGIYDVENEILLPHAPLLNATWYLPRDYHDGSDVNFPLIEKFLNVITKNDNGLKYIIIAFCNAILKGRSDLQKILYLFGSGGNGKGSLMRLMTMLVGQQNTHSTSIHSLCNNRFELANIYEKRLVLCPDEYKQTGGLTALKSLSGEDLISGEKKGKDSFQFRFNGLAVIASNESIFKSDNSFGLERRLVRVPLEVRIPDNEKRTNLELDFEFDLPAFTSYLLMLDDDWVTKTIRDAGKHPEVVRLTKEQNLTDNSIAAFHAEAMIYEPGKKHQYLIKNMYGHYKDYCDTNGLSAKSKHNFTKGLEEWLTTNLGKPIKRVKGKYGVYIADFRKRDDSDDRDEFHSEEVESRSTVPVKEWSKPALKSSHRHRNDSNISTAINTGGDDFLEQNNKNDGNHLTATGSGGDDFGDDFLKNVTSTEKTSPNDSSHVFEVPENKF